MTYYGDDYDLLIASWETASNEELKRFISAAWKWFSFYRDRTGMDDFEWQHMVDQLDAIGAETSCGSLAGMIGRAMCYEMEKRQWEAAHGGRTDQAGAGHSDEGARPAA